MKTTFKNLTEPQELQKTRFLSFFNLYMKYSEKLYEVFLKY